MKNLPAIALLALLVAGCRGEAPEPCCEDAHHQHVYGEHPASDSNWITSRPIIDAHPDPNIVGDLSTWEHRDFSRTPGETLLDKVNHERRREGSNPIEIIDPNLHALALKKATYAAEHSIDGHIGGDEGGAKCEGVGTSNGRFMTCCLNYRATHCGAAMVQGRNAWYCIVLIK